MRAPPLAGKEEGKRLEGAAVWALSGHRFEKHSDPSLRWQRLLDTLIGRGHTATTMTRKARALELPSPLPVALLALGLVILSIVVILPH